MNLVHTLSKTASWSACVVGACLQIRTLTLVQSAQQVDHGLSSYCSGLWEESGWFEKVSAVVAAAAPVGYFQSLIVFKLKMTTKNQANTFSAPMNKWNSTNILCLQPPKIAGCLSPQQPHLYTCTLQSTAVSIFSTQVSSEFLWLWKELLGLEKMELCCFYFSRSPSGTQLLLMGKKMKLYIQIYDKGYEFQQVKTGDSHVFVCRH